MNLGWAEDGPCDCDSVVAGPREKAPVVLGHDQAAPTWYEALPSSLTWGLPAEGRHGDPTLFPAGSV